MTIVVITAISTDYVNWDRLNRDFVASNELSRAFLASFILVMDLMIVMQVNNDKRPFYSCTLGNLAIAWQWAESLELTLNCVVIMITNLNLHKKSSNSSLAFIRRLASKARNYKMVYYLMIETFSFVFQQSLFHLQAGAWLILTLQI